jgi:hypothetical protein
MILYILYFTVKAKDQAIISNWKEYLIHNLSMYKKDKKFLMASYLVFAIAHFVNFLNVSRNNVIFKVFSIEKLYGIIEYDENTIDNWLVDYSINNRDIEEVLHGISINLRYLEGELFNIKIQHEINVAPMKSYIEEWFKKAIDKLTNEGK